MGLLYEELTYKIRKCLFEVRKEVGYGFDEETYHQALIVSFQNHKIPFKSKEKRSLLHRGICVRNFINDFLLFDKIILSLKCFPNQFIQAHYIQLFSELKIWNKGLGLLVNYGLPKLEIERYIFKEKEPIFQENYEYLPDYITTNEKSIITQITSCIKYAAKTHKPGYNKTSIRSIKDGIIEY